MASYPEFLKEIEERRGIKIKVKGQDVGKPNCFNKSLIIIKKALINHFIEGKTIYDTIRENQDLIDYQIIKKQSAKTSYIDKGTTQRLPDKVLRLFPVTEGGLELVTDKWAKIPEVPTRTVLIKDDITNMKISDIEHFDINYYVDIFKDKLNGDSGWERYAKN